MNFIQLLKGPNLKFKVDPMWEKRSFLIRFFARIVAKMIFYAPGDTYQFGGWNGALKLSYEMIDADKFQLMHWILRESGYSCCCAEIIERCGISYKEYEKRKR